MTFDITYIMNKSETMNLRKKFEEKVLYTTLASNKDLPPSQITHNPSRHPQKKILILRDQAIKYLTDKQIIIIQSIDCYKYFNVKQYLVLLIISFVDSAY